MDTDANHGCSDLHRSGPFIGRGTSFQWPTPADVRGADAVGGIEAAGDMQSRM